jgi:hypothetical protein
MRLPLIRGPLLPMASFLGIIRVVRFSTVSYVWQEAEIPPAKPWQKRNAMTLKMTRGRPVMPCRRRGFIRPTALTVMVALD